LSGFQVSARPPAAEFQFDRIGNSMRMPLAFMEFPASFPVIWILSQGRRQSKSQISNTKSQINYNDQNSKFQTQLHLLWSLLHIVKQCFYHENTNVLRHQKLKRCILLVWPVSVIDYCDLGFICYLVLGIWNLYLADCALLSHFYLPRYKITPGTFSCSFYLRHKPPTIQLATNN
jgi:hypothetical protein